MAEELQKKVRNFSQETESLATEMKNNESKTQKALQDSKAALDAYSPKDMDPEVRNSAYKAISDAENLYRQRATRNDWLEVAQNLAGALAQFGAARQGMRTGRDMTGVTGGQNVDWQARTERAYRETADTRKDLLGDVESQGKMHSLAEKVRQEAAKQKADAYKDEAKLYSDKAKQQESLITTRDIAEMRDKADWAKLSVQEKNADKRAAAAEKAQGLRDRLQEDKERVLLYNKNLEQSTSDLRAALKQQAEAGELVDTLMKLPDMSSKQRKVAEAKVADIASRSGVDLNTVQAELDRINEEQPGWFSDKTPKTASQIRQELLQKAAGDISSKVSELSEKRDKLLKTRPSEYDPNAGQVQQEPAVQKPVESVTIDRNSSEFKAELEKVKKELEAAGATATEDKIQRIVEKRLGAK